jgi:serine/threonine protein kinase
MEFIEGRSLQSIMDENRHGLSLSQALGYASQIAALMARIHASGWVWRDCKPSNLILTREGALRPLDFEGTCRVVEPDLLPWVTSGYVACDSTPAAVRESVLPEDLYALGVTLHQLLSGLKPDETGRLPSIEKVRSDVTPVLRRVISGLLSRNPNLRPDAQAVACVLRDSQLKARRSSLAPQLSFSIR